jgi:hypothetical protein
MATKTTKKPTVTKAAPKTKTSTGREASSGDASRLISLANGRYAYVCYPRGASTRLSTDSPEFDALLGTMVAAGMGPRLRGDITGFAQHAPESHWPSVLARLEAAALFGE